MIIVHYKNSQPCVIRPTPLVSISQTPIKTKLGTFGSTYNITLNGAIIAYDGSPFYDTTTGNGPSGVFTSTQINYQPDGSENRPASEEVSIGNRLDSIFAKQHALRELFALDGQKIEIKSINGSGTPIVCYPSVDSITFDEGQYTDIARYTINLTANTLQDKQGNVLSDGRPLLPSGNYSSTDEYGNPIRQTESDMMDFYGGFVEDFNDTWAVEVDEGFGQEYTGGIFTPRAYRVTRNMTATGRVMFLDGTRHEAWSQAQKFLKKYVLGDGDQEGLTSYPAYDEKNIFASGFLNLENYRGYNHLRTENIDKSAGSYSISDTWLLASGDSAIENFNMSISAGIDDPFVRVSIDGNIRGLSSLPASGYTSDTSLINFSQADGKTPFQRARDKYLSLSNSGQYGVGCDIYKRANNMTEQVLNSQPATISLGSNELTGELTYNLEFNNRPANIFTGVLSETIDISDTAPGDVFAVIPVLGRSTGPILQYIGGRTEYQRSVSVSMTLDHTDIGYGDQRQDLILRKPSINEPLRTELKNVITQTSPANEPGVRKYFVTAPQESWNPKTGNYSLTVSWTYELDN